MWSLFADADLSWAVDELSRFHRPGRRRPPIVIGSREGSGARRIGEPVYRHVMGRVFNGVVQRLAVPGIEDSQCGFKAFDSRSHGRSSAGSAIDGFGFDVEVLYLARKLGYAVRVVPLRWEHKENSRVAPVRDTLRMLSDVVRVRTERLARRLRLGALKRALDGGDQRIEIERLANQRARAKLLGAGLGRPGAAGRAG